MHSNFLTSVSRQCPSNPVDHLTRLTSSKKLISGLADESQQALAHQRKTDRNLLLSPHHHSSRSEVFDLRDDHRRFDLAFQRRTRPARSRMQRLLQQDRQLAPVVMMGGDEFGVLLSHAGQDQALKKADVLAEALRHRPVQWNGNEITVSFAYGAFKPKAGDDAGIAMARAEEAMYV